MPDRRQIAPWAQRVGTASWAFVGTALAGSIVVVAIGAVSELVAPLVVAVVAAVVFAPTVDWIEAHGIPRSAAAVAVTVMSAVIAAAFVAVVVVGVVDRADELAAQFDRAWAELADASESDRLSSFLERVEADVDRYGATLLQGIGARLTSVIGSAVAWLSGLVLALVLLYYLLKDGRSLVDRSLRRRAPAGREQAERILRQAAATVRANSQGRTVLATVQGLFTFAVMAVLGVPLPASVGIVNFIGAYVPFLGAFVGGAFAVVLALSEGGIPLAIWALLAVLFMNLVLENLLEPRLVGSHMRMHPIVVLTATVAGGLVAGLLGLVLAAPVVAISSNLLRELRAAGFFDRRVPRGVGGHEDDVAP